MLFFRHCCDCQCFSFAASRVIISELNCLNAIEYWRIYFIKTFVWLFQLNWHVYSQSNLGRYILSKHLFACSQLQHMYRAKWSVSTELRNVGMGRIHYDYQLTSASLALPDIQKSHIYLLFNFSFHIWIWGFPYYKCFLFTLEIW